MTLRPGFLKIIDGWNRIADVNDVPRRLKRLDEWKKTAGEYTEAEQNIVDFMRDVQSTREFVRRKYPEIDGDDE